MAVTANQSLSVVSTRASDNTAVIRYTVTCTTSGESWNGYTQTGTFTIDGISYSNSYTLPKNTTTTVFSKDVTVSNASDRTISASYSFPTTPSGGTKTGSTSVKVPTIPRYATANQSLNSKTSSSIRMNWSSDSTIDYIWYSINNGSSWVAVGSVNASSGNYNITGLSSNTTYNIKTRVRRKDSQLTTDSSTLSIATYPTTVASISVSSKTVNSVTVTSSCNVAVSSTQYRIKTSSGSYGAYQTSPTFTGLSPNTSYVVEVKKVGQASGEVGTATVLVTTYQIATISSASNFNHGDNSTLSVSNPSGASMTLQMKIGNTQIFSSSVSAGTVTHIYTDTELDNIYRLYSTGNSLTVTYIVSITVNSQTYTNSRTATVTLTGNQKTAYTGSGKKRVKVYVGVNGSVKRAVVWIGNNGRKRCI